MEILDSVTYLYESWTTKDLREDSCDALDFFKESFVCKFVDDLEPQWEDGSFDYEYGSICGTHGGVYCYVECTDIEGTLFEGRGFTAQEVWSMFHWFDADGSCIYTSDGAEDLEIEVDFKEVELEVVESKTNGVGYEVVAHIKARVNG